VESESIAAAIAAAETTFLIKLGNSRSYGEQSINGRPGPQCGHQEQNGSPPGSVAAKPQELLAHYCHIDDNQRQIAGNESSIPRFQKTRDKDSARYWIHLARCGPLATVPT
jgi:hypothetical protein